MGPVLHVRAFEDNYIWLIRGKSPNRVAIVDPGDEVPVIAALEREDLAPVAILCTHHHWDHTGGIADLCRRWQMPVYGPAAENIPAVTHPVHEGDDIELPELSLAFTVIEVPGHTRGHIAYYGQGMLFCGDTLFSAGCGRLFEGTATQMHDSLGKLAALPPETRVYCAHEYTLANLRFALTVEPENKDIQAHYREVQRLRAQDAPTLPSTIGLEHRINPFLRLDQEAVRRAGKRQAGKALDSATDAFAAIRRWKDHYRG